MVKTQYMCEISDEILGIFCIPPSPQSFPRTVPKVPNFASSGHAQAGRVHATTKVRRLQSLRPFSGQQGILWCTQNIWTQLKYPFQSEKILPVYVCISPFKFPHLSAHSDSSANSSDTSILTESTPNPSSVSSFFIFYLLYRDQRRGSRRGKKHTGIITELNFFLLKMWIIYLVDGAGSSHCFTPRCVTSDLSWNDPHLREKVIRQITNSSHTSPTRYKNKLAIAKLWGVMDGFDSFLILSDQNC